MRGSLGLAAYRALTRRGVQPEFNPSKPRPEGELVWIHAAEFGNDRALIDLADRLVSLRHRCHILMTSADKTAQLTGCDNIIREVMPDEHPSVTDAFVDHWKPDVVMWAWGGLRPNLILSAAKSGARLMLIDADQDGFDSRRDRWLPEVPRQLLGKFQDVIVRSQAAQLRLGHLGCALEKIRVAPPLRPFGRMLPAAESDLNDIADALGGRPVWLAANIMPDEIRAVLSAHRQAMMASPRLLLVLHAANPETLINVTAQAAQDRMQLADWNEGTLPDDNTQVLLTDTAEDLGLWLRVAPVSFLGGSLHSGHPSFDPYMAAAHGTAIIYGTKIGSNADAYTRLINAGAARIVNDAATLGRAVIQLIAPDQAAQMAMAGWEVVTEGADSLDRIIEVVQAHLDATPEMEAR